MSKRAWTDEQLREAVATSKSVREVLRALGLKDGSGGYMASCIEEAGLDTSHFKVASSVGVQANGMKHELNSSERDARLREIVPKCRTATEVLQALGLELCSANFQRIRKRTTLLGLDTSHFTRKSSKPGQPRYKWTDEQLRRAVASSTSIAQTIRAVGLIPAGGNYDQIQRRIRELGLDTSHFLGMGWNKGGKFQPRVAMPLVDILVAGRPVTSHHLKERLFKEGLKKRECELCGWATQAIDGRIPLELDHINGDKTDNRLDNLRVLCPNCHSLQPTHRGLNKKTRRQKN